MAPTAGIIIWRYTEERDIKVLFRDLWAMNINAKEIEGIITNIRIYTKGSGPLDLNVPERETSKSEVEDITKYKMYVHRITINITA